MIAGQTAMKCNFMNCEFQVSASIMGYKFIQMHKKSVHKGAYIMK